MALCILKCNAAVFSMYLSKLERRNNQAIPALGETQGENTHEKAVANLSVSWIAGRECSGLVT